VAEGIVEVTKDCSLFVQWKALWKGVKDGTNDGGRRHCLEHAKDGMFVGIAEDTTMKMALQKWM